MGKEKWPEAGGNLRGCSSPRRCHRQGRTGQCGGSTATPNVPVLMWNKEFSTLLPSESSPGTLPPLGKCLFCVSPKQSEREFVFSPWMCLSHPLDESWLQMLSVQLRICEPCQGLTCILYQPKQMKHLLQGGKNPVVFAASLAGGWRGNVQGGKMRSGFSITNLCPTGSLGQ